MKENPAVSVRFLRDNERQITTNENETPLLIEPGIRTKDFNLCNFLSDHSEDIMNELKHHGAVLLRGFKVNNEKEYEQVVNSITGLNPMNNYFMSEKGRTLLEGSNYVYYTNKIYKTGGSFNFGGFHNENYYSTDVPHFITFCCIKPSWLGGETGLVNMTKVYDDLPGELKQKLERDSFLTVAHTVSGISTRYGISDTQVKEICSNFGLPMNSSTSGDDLVLMYKPSVINHPYKNNPALVTNLSLEIKPLDSFLLKEFKNDFSGIKWTLHRLTWRHRWLKNLLQLQWSDVSAMISSLSSSGAPKKVINNNVTFPYSPERVGSVFNEKEIILLAKSIRRHFTSFSWRKGDVLLIDNLQIAHSGMPGFGPRTIRTIICNPIAIDFAFPNSGKQNIVKQDNNLPLATVIENSKKPVDVTSKL